MADLLCLLLVLLPFRLPVPATCPSMIPPLQRVAYAMDLSRPGVETWSSTAFRNELSWCRQQRKDMRHLPAIGHAAALPTHAECGAYSHWWAARACWLRHQQMMRLHLDLQELVGSAELAACYWRTAAVATNTLASTRSRREALAECWRIEEVTAK